MKPGDKEWEESVEAMKELGQAQRMQEEAFIGVLGWEPERAAKVIESIFHAVIWEHENPTGTTEGETKEEQAKRKQEWDAEMAVFWKRLDQLQGHIIGYPDRPEFDPD